MNEDRKPTEVEVELLDFTKELAATLEQYKEADPERFDGYEELHYTGRLGFVRVPEGLHLINTEGCSPSSDEMLISPDLPAGQCETIPIYGRGKERLGIMPVLHMHADYQDILEHATGEKVNLAEFIRVFGNRLEANYDNWRRHLEGLLNA